MSLPRVVAAVSWNQFLLDRDTAEPALLIIIVFSKTAYAQKMRLDDEHCRKYFLSLNQYYTLH